MSTYDETVRYLYNLQREGIKLGLDNTERLLQVLGSPHTTFRSIHIAGTNGKGSTAAIIASILKSSGYKVGLYTSPHLVSFTERIRVNGSPISEDDVIQLASSIRDMLVNRDMSPTFFELATVMAFSYFANNRVDWAVIETGMGGRLDATNVISPEACVITNIGVEHTEFLGDSITQIAHEKAGIIKKETPVVTATDNDAALDVLRTSAEDLNADIHVYGQDFFSILAMMDTRGITFEYRDITHPRGWSDPFSNGKNFSIPVTGRYQMVNASLAIRACEVLKQRDRQITGAVIQDGLSRLAIEGRLEYISLSPRIILDSAHNPEAVRSLSHSLKELFPEKKFIIITGLMKDKDIEGFLNPLIGLADTIILTSPKGERAASPEMLKSAFLSLISQKENRSAESASGKDSPVHISLVTTDTVAEALERAKRLWTEGTIILVTGSFYITGEVKELLGHPSGALPSLRE